MSAFGAPPRIEFGWYGLTVGARSDHRAIYDRSRDGVIVIGGKLGGSGYQDAWLIPLNGIDRPRRIGGARGGHFGGGTSAAMDPKHDRLFAFGGYEVLVADCCYGYAIQDEGVMLTTQLGEEEGWHTLAGNYCPSCTRPARRFGSSLTYDSRRGRLLAFGGGMHTHPYGFVDLFDRANDLWEFLPDSTEDWSELHPSGSPPSLAYSVDGRAFLDAAHDRMLYVLGGRVWSLNLATLHWDSLTNSPAKIPDDAAIAFDPDRSVLFAVHFGNVWRLEVAAPDEWQPVAIAPAGAIPNGEAIWDPSRARLVIFSGPQTEGAEPSGPTPVLRWLDPRLAVPGWQILYDGRIPSGLTPTSRAIYDTRRDRVVLFAFAGQRYELVARPETGRWEPIPASSIDATASLSSAVYDPLNDRVLAAFLGSRVFAFDFDDGGGWQAVGGALPEFSLVGYLPGERRPIVLGWNLQTWTSEVFELRPSAAADEWVRVPMIGAAPPPRWLAEFQGEFQSPRLHYFAGTDFLDVQLDSLWTLEVADSARWSRRAWGGWIASPYPGTAFDPYRGIAFVYGYQAVGAGWRYEGQALNVRTNRVDQFAVTGEPTLPVRDGAFAIYDPVHDRFLFGGGRSNPTTYHDVFAFAWPASGTVVPVGVTPADPGPANVTARFVRLDGRWVLRVEGGSRRIDRVELFDVAGRRVGTRRIDATAGVGAPLQLEMPASMRRGIYFARVSGLGFRTSLRVPALWLDR